MHLPRDATTLLHRAFGGPFGGGCGVGFFPPFGVECTTTTTTSSTTSPEKTTTKTQKAPTATKTTVIVSPTIVTSVVVVTSGNTITAGTTFTSGTTVTSVITPAPPSTPVPTDTSSSTSSDTSAIGDSSSALSSPPVSSNAPQPTAIPAQTITDTETLVLSNSPPSSSVLTQPTSSSTTSSTSIPTLVPTQSTPQLSRGMSTGEIAAICIACVALVAISVLIWIARRKRTARRSEAAASGPADPGDEENAPASNVAEPSIRAAAASPAPDSHRMSPDVAEHMEEKRDTISRYSDSGETASSPGSSTALSSFPLLSPGPLTPTDAEPAFAQMRSFRLAWDDPPPTPDRRPVSLQSGQGAAYRRSQGGDGYLAATTMENYDRNSVYAAYLAREGGRSEVTLGQPPEYSRY